MQTYRCKCGESIMWNTGEKIHDCQGCEKCQTTFAQHPAYHHKLEPHEWEHIKEIREVNGKKEIVREYKRCKRCNIREYIKPDPKNLKPKA